MERQTIQMVLGPGAVRHPDRQEVLPPGAPASLPPVFTLGELLEYRVRATPESVFGYFIDVEERVTRVSWQELRLRAGSLALGLRRQGVGPGDRVLLSLQTSPELLEGFFACQLLGAIPCLSEAPGLGRGLRSWMERLIPKLRVLEPRAIVTEGGAARPVADGLAELLGQARPSVHAVEELWSEGDVVAHRSRPEDISFLQFTSGTTLAARAVTCTHQALLTNARCVAGSGGQQWLQSDLVVGWLPLFHDMGLVATTLSGITHGVPVALMPPAAFITRPTRWLWAMHVLRGSLSFAPNFAYQLCLKRVQEAEVQGLDLSSWRIAYNGAEFVHADTVRRFAARFAAHGFPAQATVPSYGMAEMVVAVSFHEAGVPLTVDTVSRSQLARDGRAVPVPANAPDGLEVVSVGRVVPGHEVQIRGDDGRVLGDREQGQIALRGPSLFQGYYRDPESSHEVLQDRWLLTGDMGYLVDGQLYISGRCKDLIIRGGENYHPYVMEGAASAVAKVREGCVAAVGLANGATGTEDIAIVFETAESDPEILRQLRLQVEEQVRRVSGLRPDHLLAVPPRTIPKTSSGKIRRGAVREIVLQHLATERAGRLAVGS
ncbi:AMP-binding protein [Hyalangium versicolor]|uniref:AMP-binding protein n=1 Tax=Hyalangium versicolor TaxID=2861190 RepID=UPI001CCFED35|nr:AMP-binding protein [Hyalangium versicolor]